jgi:hypothetical protein
MKTMVNFLRNIAALSLCMVVLPSLAMGEEVHEVSA